MLSDEDPTRPARPTAVPLAGLAALLERAGGARLAGAPVGSAAATGVTLSSDRTRPGDLYAALPGARAHGADFAGAARRAGAVAVLTDDAGLARLDEEVRSALPVLVVADPRAVLGAVAARTYGDPAAALRLCGVTGTQGKTTVTRLLEAGLAAAGVPAAVVGTVGTRVLGAEVETALTTPEAPDLHGLFARMREQGVDTCAMEVSSHALVKGRVDGVVFDVAVFTNLGRDHLDFHADEEDYFAAKARLFGAERCRRALVNLDDAHARRLLADPAVPTRSFSAAGDPAADWRAVDVVLGAEGSRFTVVGPDGARVETAVPVPGDFNVANALAALAAAAELGHDLGAVAAGVAAGPGVPGRLERVATDLPCTVVVDYAHKPDAVAATLRTLRPLARAAGGRLVVVIGAGGDRDPGKRPVMGRLAAELADVVVVTDDNPRSEDPAAIRAALLDGAREALAGGSATEVHEVGDRRGAVRAALAAAGPGDLVLVAGKGHETGQVVGRTVHPFDDRVVVAEEAAALVAAAGAGGDR